MTLERDLRGLPTRDTLRQWAPESADTRLGPAIEAWWAEQEDEPERAKADETLPYRASWAGLRCDRQLWYALHGAEQSNPMSVADKWRVGTGSMGHALLLDKIGAGLAEDEMVVLERPVDLRPLGIEGSGHADAIIVDVSEVGPGMSPHEAKAVVTEVIELKTVGGFQFKIMTLPFKGGPRGPRYEAVIQGALMAAALNCRLRLCYVSLELVGADITKDRGLGEERRFAAEWVLDAEQCAEIARVEARRIAELLDDIVVPRPRLRDPEATDGAVVSDQDTGAWVARTPDGDAFGRTWRCGYCGQRDRCKADGL